MLPGPTYRRAGFLVLTCHLANLANLAKLSHEPSVDFFALVASIIQTVITAVHLARDALDGVIGYTFVGNGKQSILVEEHSAVSKAYSSATKSGSVITFGTPMSDENAR